MLPNNNTLYIKEDKKEFISLNNVRYDPLSCWRKGGYDLGNTAFGIDYQIWTLKYKDNKFILSDETNKEIILKELSLEEINSEDVKKVSFSFDQNMRCVWGYSYIKEGVLTSKFYWFDITINDYREMVLINTKEIILDLDDKRKKSNNINDIILAYINTEDYICVRYQRDRYNKEYQLKRLPPNTIISAVGLTKDYRFQFELTVPDFYKHDGHNFLIGSI